MTIKSLRSFPLLLKYWSPVNQSPLSAGPQPTEAVQQNCHLGTAQESFDVCLANPPSSRPYSSQARRRWQRDTPLLRLPNPWPTPTHTPPQREKGRTDQSAQGFFQPSS